MDDLRRRFLAHRTAVAAVAATVAVAVVVALAAVVVAVDAASVVVVAPAALGGRGAIARRAASSESIHGRETR
jgi:hypothetical protein